MKKPNKIYKKLGGKRSAAGSAFAMSCHPVRSLRSAFGFDAAAKNVAEGYNLGPCKHAYQLVMATLKSWGKSYRGPKLSWMFAMKTYQPKKIVDTHRPEFD
jgi:hypothetical protein